MEPAEYLGSTKLVNTIIPVVSVCVITYNHASYIKECLDSILMQETDFDYEIILGEDDSTDGTREICIEYAEKHPDKIRLFLRSEKDKIYINGKKTGRFNILECYKASRGKYIAICEGDDYWLVKNKLQMQRDFMDENPKCHLICHRMPSRMKSTAGWYDFKDLATKSYLPHASNYFMKQFDLNKYQKAFYEFLGGEMLVLYIAAKEGLVYHHDSPVSYYRVNEGGVYTSLNRTQKLEGQLYQLDTINRYFPLPKTVYRTRKKNLVLKYNTLTNKRSTEASLYRFQEILIQAKKSLMRRFI